MAALTGSKLDTSPPGCRIESTGRPATIPAKLTTPSSGAKTSGLGALMSMPRCPDEYGVAGAMNGRAIECGPDTGQVHTPAATATPRGSMNDNGMAVKYTTPEGLAVDDAVVDGATAAATVVASARASARASERTHQLSRGASLSPCGIR